MYDIYRYIIKYLVRVGLHASREVGRGRAGRGRLRQRVAWK